jgi:hypothetical protein
MVLGALGAISTGLSLTSGLLGLLEDAPQIQMPEPVPTSGAERQAVSAQTQVLQQIRGLEGLSSEEIQREFQLGLVRREEETRAANLLLTSQLSPFEREARAKAMQQRQQQALVAQEEKTRSLDAAARARNILTTSQVAQGVAASAGRITAGERQQAAQQAQIASQNAALQAQFKQQKMQNFAKSMGGLAKSIPLLAEAFSSDPQLGALNIDPNMAQGFTAVQGTELGQIGEFQGIQPTSLSLTDPVTDRIDVAAANDFRSLEGQLIRGTDIYNTPDLIDFY